MGHAPVPALFVHSVVAKTTLDTTAGTRTFTVPAYNTLTITMQGGGGGGCSQSGFGVAGTNATISFTGFSAEADGGGGGNTSTVSGGGASGNNVVNTAGSPSNTSNGISGAGAPPTGGAAAGVGAAGNIYGGGGGGSSSAGFLGGGGGGYGKSSWTLSTANAPKQGTVITYTVPGNAAAGAGSPSGGVGAKGYVQFVVS